MKTQTADQGENEKKDSRKYVCVRRNLLKSISYGQNVCNSFSRPNRKAFLLIEKWNSFFSTKDCPEYVVNKSFASTSRRSLFRI